MSLMKKVKGNKAATEQEQEAGMGEGGFFTFEKAQIVQIKIKKAGVYAYASGALGGFVEFSARTASGVQELQKISFFANKEGNFTPDYGYGEKPTQGYTELNMIAQLVSKGKRTVDELKTVAGKVTAFGQEQDCDIIPSLTGAQMFFAVVPTRKNRMAKNPATSKYDIKTSEEDWEYKILNVLDKSKRTLFEIKKDKDAEWATKFGESWAKKDKKFIDKFKEVTASSAHVGQSTDTSVDELAEDDDL